MVHLISYDLVGNYVPSYLYENLEGQIKSYGTWFHFQKSEWLIETEKPERDVVDHLKHFVRPFDRLMVTRIHRSWSSINLTDEEVAWLSARNFGSLAETLASVFTWTPAMSPAGQGGLTAALAAAKAANPLVDAITRGMMPRR